MENPTEITLKQKMKEFWFRFKIFLLYLVTEPFIQIRDLFRAIYNILLILNQLNTWMYILLVLGILFLIYGNKLWASFLFFVLLIAILLWEWESGFFMYRYRQRIKDNIKKKIEQEAQKDEKFKKEIGGENNGFNNSI